MTPEGKVKEKIKRRLERLREGRTLQERNEAILSGAGQHGTYWHMPVQNGMGAPTLDFICCIAGLYVAIEAKRPGEYLTPRQQKTCADIAKAGGRWFCIDDSPESWETFEFWLRSLRAEA